MTGIVILLFCAVVLRMALYLNLSAKESLTLGLEKEGLVKSLQRARDELETRVEARTAELSLINDELRREVSERVQAEEFLSKSEERYRLLVDNVQESIFVAQDGRLTFMNPTTIELFGYSKSELLSKPFVEFIHPDDRELVYKNHLRRITGEQIPQRYPCRILHKTGAVRWVEITSVMIRWDERPAVLVFMTDITNSKEAEDALRNSESTLRDILSTSPVGIVGLAGDRTIKWVNESCLEMFGFQNDEVVGHSAAIVYPSEAEYNRVGKAIYEGVKAGKVTSIDALLRRKDSSLFDAYIRMKESGKPDLVIAAISDMSERRRVEDALRESEEKYRLVVENAQEAISVAQDGMLRFVNPKTVDILGYSENELLTKPFSEFIHTDDREIVLERHARRMRGEKFPTRYSFRVVAKDGALKWVEIDSAEIVWAGRQATLTFMADITERIRMEEELKESEERYRTLVEESFDGMFIQKGFEIVFANARLHEMLGYSAGELRGLDHWVIYHPDYQALTRQRATARMQGEDVVSQYEVRLQRKDGAAFDGEISARGVKVKGEPGILVWVKDTSQRRRSEEAQRRLFTAVEQAADAIMVTDVKGKIEYVNPAFEKVTGHTLMEVVGQNPRLLKSGEHDQMFYKNLWNTITRGEVWTGRFINRTKNGKLFHEAATISPVRDAIGKIVNFVAVKHDMTEHLKLSEQLVQAQKMEAIGTLAGGIAHDFNNLLQVTLGYSEFLLAEKRKDDPEFEDLSKIFQAAQSGAELVQRLLMFSRKVESKPIPLNLNKQIVQVEKLLRRTIPKMIDIKLDLSQQLMEVEADPTQVEQILMNLAINARDAMPDGGRLTINTKNTNLDEEYCKIHVGVKPGVYVALSVSDTGRGIDAETVEHIFEPFFTTKEIGRGTGLGLATVYGIIRQHGGHIICESEVCKGSTFSVYFPAILSRLEHVAESVLEMPACGTETVLLVDDEDSVRELGNRIMTNNGYKVLTAANGEAALEVYGKEKERIALVILDLIMPIMGGKDCLKKILAIDPHAKILIASGYSADASTREFIELGAQGFVSKPFRLNELLRQVRKALDER